MVDWKIRSRSHECQSCAVSFEDGQVYHTLLYSEREEYHRIDVCRDCWDGQYGQGASDRKGYVSHWAGRYLVPPPPPPEPIQKESADSALRKLVELNDTSYVPVCFILATMLERKRLLRVREEVQEEEGGKRRYIYEYPKTGEIFSILDPDLKLDELEQVQRDVSILLEKGVDHFLGEADESEEAEAEAEPVDEELDAENSDNGEEPGDGESDAVATDEVSSETVSA